MTQTRANCFILPMKSRIARLTSVGRISGTTMCHVRRQPVAPSTRAASRYSAGMAWMAARRTTMLKPANIQVVTRISAGSAVAGLRQPGLGVLPQADRPEHEVRHAPVVVVDPQPDHADHRVGHQHRREPDRAEEAGEGHPAARTSASTNASGMSMSGATSPQVSALPRGLPEDVVARQDLAEVLKADELVLHAEVHPEGVDAVVEGDQDGVDRERRGIGRGWGRGTGRSRPRGGGPRPPDRRWASGSGEGARMRREV